MEISSFIETRNIFVGNIISYEFRVEENRNERKKGRTCLKNSTNSTNFPYLLRIIVFFFFLFHLEIVVFMKFDEIESNFRMEVPGHHNILTSIQGKIFLDCPSQIFPWG